jgi:hypothetical protein
MTSLAPTARVVREPVDETIRRLETFVSRMERRYECASDVMENDVRSGRIRETAEVSKWLAEFHVLLELRALAATGPAAGATSRSTRKSTTDECSFSTTGESSKTTT